MLSIVSSASSNVALEINLDTLIEQCHWFDEFGNVGWPLAGGSPYLKQRYYANYILALDAGDLKDLFHESKYCGFARGGTADAAPRGYRVPPVTMGPRISSALINIR